MIKILRGIDKPLLIITIILFALGLVTIFSASNVMAYMLNEADPSRYFTKELGFLAFGLLLSAILFIFPTKKYPLISWSATIFVGFVIFVLAIVGQMVNGMSGWLNSTGSGQPSEIAKVFIIPLIATFYDHNIKHRDNFVIMLIPMIVAGIVAFGIVLQGDLGTAIIFFGLCLLMFYFSPVGRKIKLKCTFFGLIVAAFLALIVFGFDVISEDKMERFNYSNPCDRYITYGNQLCNGYIAINGGGLTGKGLGDSTQKYLYLPEAHTDFIFAIYVEELGAIGAIALFVLYFMLLVRIIVIGKRSSKLANSLICYGVSFYLFMHIMVNLTGVLGLLPMTGVPLPFLSYGGSICLSIIFALTMVQRIAYENNEKNLQKT